MRIPRGSLRLVLRSMIWLVVAVVVAASILELGAWQRTETFAGPFLPPPDSPNKMSGVRIGAGIPFSPVFDAGGDSVEYPNRSDLRLLVNGEDWGSIRNIPPTRAIHWGPYLQFDVPPAIADNSSTKVTATYSVRLQPAIYRLLGYLLITLLVIETFFLYRVAPLKAQRIVAAAATRAREKLRRIPLRRVRRSVTGLLLLLLVAASVLELGIWKRTETFSGPFPEVIGSPDQMVAVQVGRGIPYAPVLDPGGDSAGHPKQSDLHLWVNAENWGSVRDNPPTRMMHWGTHLQVHLPSTVTNSSATTFAATYPIRLRPDLYDVLVYAFAILLGAEAILLYRASRWNLPQRIRDATKWLLLPLLLVSWTVVAASLLYGATILYGLLAGHARPTASAFHLLPDGIGAELAAIEPFFPIFALAFAAIGAGAAWLGAVNILDPHAVRRAEGKLMHLWGLAGPLVILCLLLFAVSVGGWSGRYRSIDLHLSSFLGQLPYSDAHGYLESATTEAITGHSSSIGARRPIAEALRDSFFFFSNYSHDDMIIIQVCAIAAALFFAVQSLARWRGIWPAIAFVALIYAVSRPFLVTTLTEPLSLIPCLVALPFLFEALRRQSVHHALIALVFISMAFAVRMGSLFSILFLMLWIPLAFAKELKQQAGILALTAIAVMSVFVLNYSLAALYSPGTSATGANFSLTLCGLSVGGTWEKCAVDLYGADRIRFQSDEMGYASFILEKTWENIQHNPSILLSSLFYNASYFLRDIPVFYLRGYISIFDPMPGPSFGWKWAALLFPGLVYLFSRRASFAERLFWPGLLVSITLSAAVIMADDGWRVLFVTHAIMAAFLALGFTAPTPVSIPLSTVSPSWRVGASMAAAMAALLLVVPALSHWQMASYLRQHNLSADIAPDDDPGHHVILGGKKMAGFLVVPDGSPSSPTTASVHFSEFAKIFQRSSVHSDPEKFLSLVQREMPFAFVWGPRLMTQQSIYFVAPTEVLERKDVAAWRFTIDESKRLYSKYIAVAEVKEAQPMN